MGKLDRCFIEGSPGVHEKLEKIGSILQVHPQWTPQHNPYKLLSDTDLTQPIRTRSSVCTCALCVCVCV